jgi:tetratricopeptide (TPR) repeat protein
MIEVVLLICYAPALHGGFLWDDGVYISTNPVLRTMRGLWAIWADPSATCQYYPLSFTAFWIINHFFGMTPVAFHLATLMMHGVVAMVFWQLLERLRVKGALLGAAIFALHPLNVMSVAWMTELKNTLSCALALGAALAYVRYAGLGEYEKSREGKSGRGWYGVALGLFGVAMLAKTAVSFLPVSLLLVVWWQRRGLSRRDLLSVAPMFGLAVGMGALTIYIERHAGGASGAEFNIGFVDRVLISGRSFWFYLGKFVWPSPLIFIYPRWKVDGGVWWQWLYPIGTVAVLFGSWLARGRIGRGVFVGLMHFYVSTSMLVLAVILYMMRYSFVADHWAYFGSLGLAALAGAGIARVTERLGEPWGKPLGVGIGVCLVLGLGALTFAQSGMYADIETLWRTTLDRNPDCWMADNNLGMLMLNQGKLQEAIPMFRDAIRADPGFSDAHYNLGLALAQAGQFSGAIEQYVKALEIEPSFPEAYNNLAGLLDRSGHPDEAIGYYQKALEINGHDAEAWNNLGGVLVRKGDLDQGIVDLKKALEIKPAYAEAHYNLGIAYRQKGEPGEAIAEYEKALEIKADFAGAQGELAYLLAVCRDGRLRDGAKAEQLAKRADQLAGGANPVVLGTLAAAYAEQGRFDEAKQTVQRAIELAQAQGNAGLRNALQGHLKLYQAGQPLRDL